jgi:hypothetical protein
MPIKFVESWSLLELVGEFENKLGRLERRIENRRPGELHRPEGIKECNMKKEDLERILGDPDETKKLADRSGVFEREADKLEALGGRLLAQHREGDTLSGEGSSLGEARWGSANWSFPPIDTAIRRPGETSADSEKASLAVDLYVDRGMLGNSLTVYLDSETGYGRAPRLRGEFNDAISSLSIRSPMSIRGDVILFENAQFCGRFERFSGGPRIVTNVHSLATSINDKASSVLLVRRYDPNRELTFTLGRLGLREKIEAAMANALAELNAQIYEASHDAGPNMVSTRGEPIVTWDMFPTGSTWGGETCRRKYSELNRGSALPLPADFADYVCVRVPLHLNIPCWFDYDAEIRYWMCLRVDKEGKLRVWWPSIDCWVEDGIYQDRICRSIGSHLPNVIAPVQKMLQETFAEIQPMLGSLEKAYLLPGAGLPSGHTEDDVTLVLVKK